MITEQPGDICETCMHAPHDCHCPDPDPNDDPALDEDPPEDPPSELDEFREIVARETIAANKAIK